MIGSPLARAQEAPGRGFHWGMATFHPSLPRGTRVTTLPGRHARADPARPRARERRHVQPDGRAADLDGDDCGYEDIPSFHRAEVMVAPSLQTEGKQLQRQQSVGMGSNGRRAVANGVAVSDD